MARAASEDDHEHGHGRAHGHSSHGPQQHGGEHEEHEGAPEWLISFADNVMLMMGVFVILLALNMGKSSSAHSSSGDDAEEQSAPAEGAGGYSDEELDFAIAVRAAFNNAVDVDSTDPRDAQLVKRLRERLLRGIDEERTSGEAPFQPPLGNEEYSRVAEVVTFGEFSTEIDVDGIEAIKGMAPRLSGLRYAIDIRGHASAWETMHAPESGFKLAYDRALAVARVLVEQGISWQRIRIVSCGDAESRSSGEATGRDKAAPQRVEIVLTGRLAEGAGQRRGPAAPGASGGETPREHSGRLPE